MLLTLSLEEDKKKASLTSLLLRDVSTGEATVNYILLSDSKTVHLPELNKSK